eukprot:7515298-Pyramimonas_sp.AAC.1
MSEAAPLFERAIAVHEAACGSNTRELAMQLNNLAKSLREQGKYDEARVLYERSLAVREKVRDINITPRAGIAAGA